MKHNYEFCDLMKKVEIFHRIFKMGKSIVNDQKRFDFGKCSIKLVKMVSLRSAVYTLNYQNRYPWVHKFPPIIKNITFLFYVCLRFSWGVPHLKPTFGKKGFPKCVPKGNFDQTPSGEEHKFGKSDFCLS